MFCYPLSENCSLDETNALKTMAFMKEVIITLRKKIAYTAGYKLQQLKKKKAFVLCSDSAKLMICEETWHTSFSLFVILV